MRAAETAIDGWPVQFADTAGLRESEDQIEKAGIEQAYSLLNSADLIIILVDASQSISADEKKLIEQYPESILVLNKCDLLEDHSQLPEQGVAISATEQTGIEALLERINKSLVPSFCRCLVTRNVSGMKAKSNFQLLA